MGLHQSRAASEGQAPDEVAEKHKVFRSLYIRDKNLAMCRGSSSWLPSYDSNISSPLLDQSSGEEDKYAPRIELARIQDDVYRHFHSAEAPELPASKHDQLLARLEQRLDQWASIHQDTKMSISSVASVNMMLSFFTTRICVFRGSRDQRVSYRALKDAKACCILLLLATSPQPDARLMGVFDQLLDRKRSMSPIDGHETHHDDDGTAWALPKLSANFPLAAFFLVAKSVVQPVAAGTNDMLSRTEEDISLLETLRDRYVNTADHDCVQNFTRKVSRTLDSLVHIVRHKAYPEAANTPSMVFNDLSSLHSSASSQRGGSRKDTPPGPEYPAFADAMPDAMPTSSSILFPFMQPIASPPHPSPQRLGSSSSSHGGNGSGSNMIAQWHGASYKHQADPTVGRVGKRPRLPSRTDLFDMTAPFGNHGHQQQVSEDAISMFEFLTANNDISGFEADD